MLILKVILFLLILVITSANDCEVINDLLSNYNHKYICNKDTLTFSTFLDSNLDISATSTNIYIRLDCNDKFEYKFLRLVGKGIDNILNIDKLLAIFPSIHYISIENTNINDILYNSIYDISASIEINQYLYLQNINNDNIILNNKLMDDIYFMINDQVINLILYTIDYINTNNIYNEYNNYITKTIKSLDNNLYKNKLQKFISINEISKYENSLFLDSIKNTIKNDYYQYYKFEIYDLNTYDNFIYNKNSKHPKKKTDAVYKKRLLYIYSHDHYDDYIPAIINIARYKAYDLYILKLQNNCNIQYLNIIKNKSSNLYKLYDKCTHELNQLFDDILITDIKPEIIIIAEHIKKDMTFHQFNDFIDQLEILTPNLIWLYNYIYFNEKAINPNNCLVENDNNNKCNFFINNFHIQKKYRYDHEYLKLFQNRGYRVINLATLLSYKVSNDDITRIRFPISIDNVIVYKDYQRIGNTFMHYITSYLLYQLSWSYYNAYELNSYQKSCRPVVYTYFNIVFDKIDDDDLETPNLNIWKYSWYKKGYDPVIANIGYINTLRLANIFRSQYNANSIYMNDKKITPYGMACFDRWIAAGAKKYEDASQSFYTSDYDVINLNMDVKSYIPYYDDIVTLPERKIPCLAFGTWLNYRKLAYMLYNIPKQYADDKSVQDLKYYYNVLNDIDVIVIFSKLFTQKKYKIELDTLYTYVYGPGKPDHFILKVQQ